MKRCDLRVSHGVVGNGQRDVHRGRIADMDTPWTPRLDLERPAIGRFPQFPAVRLAAAVTLSTATATGITAMQGRYGDAGALAAVVLSAAAFRTGG